MVADLVDAVSHAEAPFPLVPQGGLEFLEGLSLGVWLFHVFFRCALRQLHCVASFTQLGSHFWEV